MCAGIEGGQRGSGRIPQFESAYILAIWPMREMVSFMAPPPWD